MPREEECTTNLTHLYRETQGFSVLVGNKNVREEDTLAERFTSTRQVYQKLQYKFSTELAF